MAGPSFYEPSDSTVFADELCDHTLLQTKTDKFFGFWGEFYNRYAGTPLNIRDQRQTLSFATRHFRSASPVGVACSGNTA